MADVVHQKLDLVGTASRAGNFGGLHVGLWDSALSPGAAT
jgi:hypothetical protein